MIVVDASVAVKWLLPESGSAAARELLSGSERLIAPALLRVEVAAAVTRKTRLKEIAAEDAEAVCTLWFAALSRGVVTLSPDEDDLTAAVGLALRCRHPLQDCLYLALAERKEASLLTADHKFARRGRTVYEKVSLLTGADLL